MVTGRTEVADGLVLAPPFPDVYLFSVAISPHYSRTSTGSSIFVIGLGSQAGISEWIQRKQGQSPVVMVLERDRASRKRTYAPG